MIYTNVFTKDPSSWLSLTLNLNLNQEILHKTYIKYILRTYGCMLFVYETPISVNKIAPPNKSAWL